MKKFIFSVLFAAMVIVLQAQANKSDLLQNLEKNQNAIQTGSVTATLKSSSRLFKDKDDLTGVILIIPSGSTVSLLGSDSTYFHVSFEDNEGYIFKNHAVIDKAPVVITQPVQPGPDVAKQQSVQDPQENRLSYLENKYGSNMAMRLNAGKIWKGMNSEMVKDSWGTADKINRDVSGNVIKEEWIFRTTWLYFENNTLLEWGPVKK